MRIKTHTKNRATFPHRCLKTIFCIIKSLNKKDRALRYKTPTT